MSAGGAQPRGTRRGFSLVEVCVAVAILALVCAVMIPTLGNLTRVDLRRGGRQLGGNIRRAFDESALTGQIYRLVIQLPPAADAPVQQDKDAPPAIAVEAVDGVMTFTGRDGALRQAENSNDSTDPAISSFDNYFEGSGTSAAMPPPPADEATQSASGETIKAMFGINKLAQKANRATFSQVGTVELPRGIFVRDVWLEGMRAVEEHGRVELLFFPAGYTQHAILHLSDVDGNAVSLEVESITGKSTLSEGYLDIGDARDG